MLVLGAVIAPLCFPHAPNGTQRESQEVVVYLPASRPDRCGVALLRVGAGPGLGRRWVLFVCVWISPL